MEVCKGSYYYYYFFLIFKCTLCQVDVTKRHSHPDLIVVVKTLCKLIRVVGFCAQQMVLVLCFSSVLLALCVVILLCSLSDNFICCLLNGLVIQKIDIGDSHTCIYMMLHCTDYGTQLVNRVAIRNIFKLQYHELCCGYLNCCHSYCCLLGSLHLLFVHALIWFEPWCSEESNKRKLQRSKNFKDVARALRISVQDRNLNCKPTLKLVLVIIILGAFLTFFHSPAIYNTDHPSNSVSRYALLTLFSLLTTMFSLLFCSCFLDIEVF